MRLTQTNTLGIRVDSVEQADIPALLDHSPPSAAPVLYSFVNPGCVAVANRDPGYRGLLDEFDAVLPDGIGMCWAIRALHGLPAARISFDSTSLAPLVFHYAVQHGATVALVGGRPGVAERGAEQLRQAFPGLAIAAALDGYGGYGRKIDALKALSPAVVVCGMGAGAQEQFLLRLAEAGWSGLGFTCGGYLDQLTSGLRYYPDWVDAANLRWAYRLAREPRRLGRRYCVDYPIFAARLARALIARGPH
ncbi:MAG TPA: WecB/TagA/CpsF family glycosyltransferase [Acetobacteraceae bacterium]|nr:WecB/TagA/CpsF family glycosyltransferase [Acetobacteraceae bacterium]